jgi:hypothetical protein
MATARRRFEGELVCYLIAWIKSAVWGKEPINPLQINPYRDEPAKSQAMIDLERWQARRRWQIMFTPPNKRHDASRIN